MNLKKQHLKISEEALVRAIIEKEDTQLFETLYDRHYGSVYRHCLRFFKNKQDAEDLSQEIFFKVFLKLSAFSFKSKFSTWLYSFTRNYCINHTRQLKYRKLENRYVDPEELSAYYLNYNYDSSGVDQQQHLRLNYAVSLLSKQEQQLVLMKYCRQITIKELARIFELGESAVKMKLKRIKVKLMKSYNELNLERL